MWLQAITPQYQYWDTESPNCEVGSLHDDHGCAAIWEPWIEQSYTLLRPCLVSNRIVSNFDNWVGYMLQRSHTLTCNAMRDSMKDCVASHRVWYICEMCTCRSQYRTTSSVHWFKCRKTPYIVLSLHIARNAWQETLHQTEPEIGNLVNSAWSALIDPKIQLQYQTAILESNSRSQRFVTSL